jgi:hypothetical protein
MHITYSTVEDEYQDSLEGNYKLLVQFNYCNGKSRILTYFYETESTRVFYRSGSANRMIY